MTLSAGRQLAHYRLVEKIGEGGMGVVWRARDTRLDRDVVVKVLPPHVADDRDRLERFEREARTVAALNHPSIVTLYSVESVDGTPFLTMEYIDGRDLDETIPEDGLALGRFFDLAIGLADAVAAAHERGVTHRDLKPANVMVTADGRVKVLDFGLAKLAEPDVEVDPAERPTRGLTEAGRVMGTVSYMSPEQVRGDPVDHRSDIFSLGIVLYEMATGSKPFEGDSSADVISALLRDEPRSVTDLRPGLPGHLGRIVRACLEKNPDRRYQSAKDLRNALEDLKIEVSSGSWRIPASRVLPRRRRAGIAAAAAMITVTAGVLGAWIWLESRERPGTTAAEPLGPSVAVLPFENLSPDPDNAYFSEGMTEERIGTLVRVPGLKVPARTTVAAYRERDVPVERIGRELGVEAVLLGSVRKQGDRLRVSAQLVDAASGLNLWSASFDREMEDVFAIQDEISRAIADKLEVKLVRRPGRGEPGPTADVEAYNLYLQGRFLWNQRTEDGIRGAIDRFERAIAADPHFALAHAGLADAWVILPGYSEVPGDEAWPRARESALRALELDPNLAEAHTSLGMVLWSYDRDPEAAEREYRRALELDPNYATAHHWLALLLGVRPDGRPEALDHLRQAERIDPLSRIVKLALANEMLRSGNLDGGIAKLEELRRFDPEYPAHEAMAWAYLTRQRYGDAIAVLEEGVRRTDSAKLAAYLSTLYHATGRYDDEMALAIGAPDEKFAAAARLRATVAGGGTAEEIAEEVAEARRRAAERSAFETAHLAAALETHLQPRAAASLAAAALADPPPPAYPDRPDAWRALGLAQCALVVGDLDQAERWADEAIASLDEVMAEKAAEIRSQATLVHGLIAVARQDRPALDEALADLAPDGTPRYDLGLTTFTYANLLAVAGRPKEALAQLDAAFGEGFAEPLALHTSELYRLLRDDPSFQARLELHGLR